MADIEMANVRQVCDEYGREYVAYLKTLMQKKNSKGYNRVASGKMLASLHSATEQKDGEINVILYHQPYMKYIELGTRPHFPPRKVLEEWVRDKKIPTHKTKGDGLPTEKQVAYLVQQKIGREGTEGQPLMKEANDAMYLRFKAAFRDALEKDLKNVLGLSEFDFKNFFEFD